MPNKETKTEAGSQAKRPYELEKIFSEMVESRSKGLGGPLRDSAWIDGIIIVHDNMELARAAAHSLFGEKVAPEVVLEIYRQATQTRNDRAQMAGKLDTILSFEERVKQFHDHGSELAAEADKIASQHALLKLARYAAEELFGEGVSAEVVLEVLRQSQSRSETQEE